MLLIPAIDLKEGKCVRLEQGRMADATVFSDDPVAMAEHWAELGCRRLHVVDLDGAFRGLPKNQSLIERIVIRLPEIPVQVGGGIRSVDVAKAYLDAGAKAVIVGTKAVDDPDFLATLAEQFPHSVWLGLDARGGQVATEGWNVTKDVGAVELAAAAGQLALAGIVYTDIERDGMLSGLNIPATMELAAATSLPVIASGGLNDLDDLARLRAADREAKLFGAITGRAIYAGTLDFRAGQALLDAV